MHLVNKLYGLHIFISIKSENDDHFDLKLYFEIKIVSEIVWN